MPKKITTNDFIERAIKKHKDKYNYSKVNYSHSHKHVIIICKIHGDFSQRASSHLYGLGCEKCGKLVGIEKKTKSNEHFIKKSRKKHGNYYDYSKVVYTHCKRKVIIICPKHGDFSQVAQDHSRGNGCPTCHTSKGENTIRELLKKYKINNIQQHSFKNQPEHIRLCQYDFFLPNSNLVIEYHGIQHFIFVKFFHKTEEDMLKRRERDNHKKQFCIDNNIKFVEIHYNQNINEQFNIICDTFKLRETP